MSSETRVQGTQETGALAANLSVDDVMARWPETIFVFLAYKTACPGCFMAPFDTVADVAHNYQIDVDDLLRALQAQIDGAGSGLPSQE